MSTLQRDGLALAYDTGGSGGGRPMLLVHGFASKRAEMWKRTGWTGAIERKGRRWAALDLRGHGESAKPHDPILYGRETSAGDVLALAEALGGGEVDLIGYSMGAQVALEVALTAPDKVANLVLGGIGGRLLDARTSREPMAAAMEADDPDAIASPLLKSFRQFADEQGEDRLALAACVRADSPPFTRERLATLVAPTLVVAGSRDDLAGDPNALADALPGARCVVLPGCDHFSAIPHALFKASVFDWLEGWLE